MRCKIEKAGVKTGHPALFFLRGVLKSMRKAAQEQPFEGSKLAQGIHDDVYLSLHLVEREDFKQPEGMEEIARLARELLQAIKAYSSGGSGGVSNS